MLKPVVVVGSVNLDLVSRGKKIPAPGETVTGTSFRTFHGGKGANQAVAVARLGHPVSMVAKVGDDDFGRQLREGLKAANVNTRSVGVAEGVSSGVALISVDARGQNSITVVPGANGKLLPEDLERALPSFRKAGIILAQLEIPLETVEHLCEIAQRLGVPLMLDPAPARALPAKLLSRVTYLTPNETETCTLCGKEPARMSMATVASCAETLRERGARNVIVKLGARGAYIAAEDGTRRSVSSFKVQVVDSTAAGDAFNGGLAVALMRGMPLAAAARYATAVGAMSVTKAGAQPAMPTEEEVMKLLRDEGADAGSRNGRSGQARSAQARAAQGSVAEAVEA